jgi:hypothetical protein
MAAQQTIAVIGDAWTLRILRSVFRGKRRHGDFVSAFGVSRAVLSDRLGKLVAHQVLERVVQQGFQQVQEVVLLQALMGLTETETPAVLEEEVVGRPPPADCKTDKMAVTVERGAGVVVEEEDVTIPEA